VLRFAGLGVEDHVALHLGLVQRWGSVDDSLAEMMSTLLRRDLQLVVQGDTLEHQFRVFM